MTVTKTADVVRLGLSDAYDEFRSRVAEKYYKQYHDVIRKYDRNHLIFGAVCTATANTTDRRCRLVPSIAMW